MMIINSLIDITDITVYLCRYNQRNPGPVVTGFAFQIINYVDIEKGGSTLLISLILSHFYVSSHWCFSFHL